MAFEFIIIGGRAVSIAAISTTDLTKEELLQNYFDFANTIIGSKSFIYLSKRQWMCLGASMLEFWMEMQK